MDLQLALLSAVVKEGVTGYKKLQKNGIDDSQFSGDAKTVYDFITEHYIDYQEIPSSPIIYAKLDVELIQFKENVDFFIKEFKASRLHNFWQEYLQKVLISQDKKNPYRTQEIIEEGLTKAKELNLGISAVEEMYELGIEAFDLYEALANDQTGILTPWPAINKISLGFWPQDLVIFAARSGVGKTWMQLLLAQHAYEVQKKRILFISPEMPKERLALRFNAIKYKLPYDKVINGKLDPWQLKRFKEGVEATKNNKGFGVVSSKSFDYSISSLAAAISYYKPDVVFIDGVYLLKAHGVNRNEQAANLMNDIKRLAIRFNIPIIVTTQFNKSVETNKASTVKDTGIAMTDVANWNNSFAVGLIRDEEMEALNMLEFKILKAREGKKPPTKIVSWWNFYTMEFSEIEENDLQKVKDGLNLNDPFAPNATPIVDVPPPAIPVVEEGDQDCPF